MVGTTLLIIALLVVGVAAFTLPLLAPWPLQLRWVVALGADPSPLLAPSSFGCVFGEVTVELCAADLGVIALSDEPGSLDLLWVGGWQATEGTAGAAVVEAWREAHTPLLLIDAGGHLSLHGPGGAIGGLRARTGRSAPITG
jgi:hypothetical protein